MFNNQLQSNFYIYNPPTYTRYPQQADNIQPSTIDIVLSNSTIPIRDLEVHRYSLNSDHTPVTCILDGEILFEEKTIYDFKKANWTEIKHWMNSQGISLSEQYTSLNSQNIDEAIDRIMDVLS